MIATGKTLAGAVLPEIRKHQSFLQLLAACLKGSLTSASYCIIIRQLTGHSLLPRGPQSILSKWICSKPKIIKGPDNPTSQLLPTSNKRKAKTAWGKQEREKRW